MAPCFMQLIIRGDASRQDTDVLHMWSLYFYTESARDLLS